MTEKELEKKKHIVRRSYDEAKKVVKDAISRWNNR